MAPATARLPDWRRRAALAARYTSYASRVPCPLFGAGRRCGGWSNSAAGQRGRLARALAGREDNARGRSPGRSSPPALSTPVGLPTFGAGLAAPLWYRRRQHARRQPTEAAARQSRLPGDDDQT